VYSSAPQVGPSLWPLWPAGSSLHLGGDGDRRLDRPCGLLLVWFMCAIYVDLCDIYVDLCDICEFQ
jgi:hypothetical protein